MVGDDARRLPDHHHDLLVAAELDEVNTCYVYAQADRMLSVGPPARAAAGARREVARHDGDARVRRHVRHVQPAASDHASRPISTTASTCSRGPRMRRRTAGRPTTTPPASRHTYRWRSHSTGTAPARCGIARGRRARPRRPRRLRSRVRPRTARRSPPKSGRFGSRAEEAAEWAVENVEVRPGLHELAERHAPVIVSSGLPQLILPVLEREGLELEVRANFADPSPDGWRVRFRDEGPCPVCGDRCKRRSLPGGAAPSSSSATAGRTAARRSHATACSRATVSHATSTSRASRTSATTRSTTLLLRFPEPYDFELSTGRFRAFGTDLANRLEDGILYRAVDGREVRIVARPGGVDVEPLDDATRPVVAHLLGAPFELEPFYAWAADDPLLAPVVDAAEGLSPAAPAGAVRGAHHVDHGAAGLALRGGGDSQPSDRALRHTCGARVGVSDARADRRGATRPSSSRSASRGARRSTPSASRAATSTSHGLAALDDDEVRARITALRGLGPWTAEWFLARHLARPRAWPAGDLALRKAAEDLYRVDVTELGPRLDPFQNLAAHYLLVGWLTKP